MPLILIATLFAFTAAASDTSVEECRQTTNVVGQELDSTTCIAVTSDEIETHTPVAPTRQTPTVEMVEPTPPMMHGD